MGEAKRRKEYFESTGVQSPTPRGTPCTKSAHNETIALRYIGLTDYYEKWLRDSEGNDFVQRRTGEIISVNHVGNQIKGKHSNV